MSIPTRYAGLVDTSERLAKIIAMRQEMVRNVADAKAMLVQSELTLAVVEAAYIDAKQAFMAQEIAFDNPQ